jgi:hypothetical protein
MAVTPFRAPERPLVAEPAPKIEDVSGNLGPLEYRKGSSAVAGRSQGGSVQPFEAKLLTRRSLNDPNHICSCCYILRQI